MKRKTLRNTAKRSPVVRLRDPNRSLVTLWILRTLTQLNGYKKLSHSIDKNSVLGRLGIRQELRGTSRSDVDILADVCEMHRKMEGRGIPSFPAQGTLSRNIRWLSKALGLAEIEQNILIFMILLNSDTSLSDATETLGGLHHNQVVQVLSVILAVPKREIESVLCKDGILIAAGLLAFDSSSSYVLKNKLEMGKGVLDVLCQFYRDPTRLLDRFYRPAPAARTGPSDFVHAKEDYQLLRNYLGSAAQKRLSGVNVLIHGRPGTGKTQMVRTLCEDIGLSLSEVSVSRPNGNPLDREERFSAYRLAQKLLAGRKSAAILFDEVEDVFPTPNIIFGMSPKEASFKGWINRALEENPVPAFWLSNDISDMDPAYLRRFDYIMELRTPTRAVRKKIIHDYTSSLDVTSDWVDGLAGNPNLVPAYIERAAKVARHIADHDGVSVEYTIDRVIGNVLEAVGKPRTVQGGKRPLRYDPGLINANCDLVRLVQGVNEQASGRFCLYGPPGTGKTAFAQYLSEQVGKSVLVKRASDLLNKYVGGSEKNIAAMFRQATDEKAVLVLDEADSFLQDRRGAEKSWQVTQVNELLVQMENFDGIFVASTNLMEQLDAAALRRFDFKIQFNYLRPEQRLQLFMSVLRDAGFKAKAGLVPWQGKLQRLETLTPGDFAVAVRQLKVLNWQPDPKRLFEVLEAECRIKPGALRGPMGFSATLN